MSPMGLQSGAKTGEQLDDAAEDIAFIARSPDRIRIMAELLAHGQRSRDDLRAASDTSRTTVQRNLDALEERGWISNRGQRYEISPCGRLVTEAVLELVDTAGVANELQEFLRWTSLDDLDLDLRLLADAEITVVDSRDPYAPVNQHVEALEDADHYRLLLPVVGLDAMKTSHEGVMAGEQSGVVVLQREAAETVRSKPEYESLYADFLESERFRIFVVEEDVPFYLGLIDDLVQIGVEDDEGVPRALLESTADEVRDWAQMKYTGYRQQATEVSTKSILPVSGG